MRIVFEPNHSQHGPPGVQPVNALVLQNVINGRRMPATWPERIRRQAHYLIVDCTMPDTTREALEAGVLVIKHSKNALLLSCSEAQRVEWEPDRPGVRYGNRRRNEDRQSR